MAQLSSMANESALRGITEHLLENPDVARALAETPVLVLGVRMTLAQVAVLLSMLRLTPCSTATEKTSSVPLFMLPGHPVMVASN